MSLGSSWFRLFFFDLLYKYFDGIIFFVQLLDSWGKFCLDTVLFFLLLFHSLSNACLSASGQELLNVQPMHHSPNTWNRQVYRGMEVIQFLSYCSVYSLSRIQQVTRHRWTVFYEGYIMQWPCTSYFTFTCTCELPVREESSPMKTVCTLSQQDLTVFVVIRHRNCWNYSIASW